MNGDYDRNQLIRSELIQKPFIDDLIADSNENKKITISFRPKLNCKNLKIGFDSFI